MRDEARVIQLNEWAERVNASSRAAMNVLVVPEECRSARAYLSQLMTDEEAAARVAADLARVRSLLGLEEEDEDCWERARASWAEAAAEYHKERGNRRSLVEYTPAELARLRALLRREVTLERAKAEIQAHHERQRNAADWTVEALMFDLRERGTRALADPKAQARISQLGDEQITEVAARLRQLEPRIAKAWTADEAQQLIAKWGAAP